MEESGHMTGVASDGSMKARLQVEASDLLESVSELLPEGVLTAMQDFFSLLASGVEGGPELAPGVIREFHQDLWNEFAAWEPPVTADPRLAITIGWWVMANRQAHAAVMVSESQDPLDAMPNVRSAVEHAMGAVWLSAATGVEAVDSVLTRWLSDMIRGIPHWPEEAQGAATKDLIEDMRAEDVLPDAKGEFKPGNFSWLTENLGVKGLVYPYYPYLSGYCHPTMASLITLTSFGPLGMRIFKEPVRTPQGGTPTVWAVQCQCWSGLALDRILPTGLPFGARLHEIANAISLPMMAELFPPDNPSPAA